MDIRTKNGNVLHNCATVRKLYIRTNKTRTEVAALQATAAPDLTRREKRAILFAPDLPTTGPARRILRTLSRHAAELAEARTIERQQARALYVRHFSDWTG